MHAIEHDLVVDAHWKLHSVLGTGGRREVPLRREQRAAAHPRVGVLAFAAAAVVVGGDDAVRKRVQGGVGGLDEQMDLLVAGPARNLLTLSIDRLVGDVIGEQLKLPGLAVALLDRLHQRNLREENRVGWVRDFLEIGELVAISTLPELDSHGPRAFRCRVFGMPFRAKVENMVTCSGTGHLLVVDA